VSGDGGGWSRRPLHSPAIRQHDYLGFVRAVHNFDDVGRVLSFGEGIEMTRALSMLTVVCVALALLCQTADAGPLRRKNQTDPRLSAASWGVGIATTVGFLP